MMPLFSLAAALLTLTLTPGTRSAPIDYTDPDIGYFGTKTFNETGCTEDNPYIVTANLVGVCVIDSGTESHLTGCNSTTCIQFDYDNTECTGAPASSVATAISGDCAPSTYGFSQTLFLPGEVVYDELGSGKVYLEYENSATCQGSPQTFTFQMFQYCDQEASPSPTMVVECDGSSTVYESFPSTANKCLTGGSWQTTGGSTCVADDPLFTSTYCITKGPPTGQPSGMPSSVPTSIPTSMPTQPTGQPSASPSAGPSAPPTSVPTSPTGMPSGAPTSAPSGHPSPLPTSLPSGRPSAAPSMPSGQPTSLPSSVPTKTPESSSSSNGMTSGDVAAAVLGSIFGAALLAFLVLYYCMPDQARALGLPSSQDGVQNDDLKKSILTGESTGKHGASSRSSNPMRASDGIDIQAGDNALL